MIDSIPTAESIVLSTSSIIDAYVEKGLAELDRQMKANESPHAGQVYTLYSFVYIDSKRIYSKEFKKEVTRRIGTKLWRLGYFIKYFDYSSKDDMYDGSPCIEVAVPIKIEKESIDATH